MGQGIHVGSKHFQDDGDYILSCNHLSLGSQSTRHEATKSGESTQDELKLALTPFMCIDHIDGWL
jgi:hypothetical protein